MHEHRSGETFDETDPPPGLFDDPPGVVIVEWDAGDLAKHLEAEHGVMMDDDANKWATARLAAPT